MFFVGYKLKRKGKYKEKPFKYQSDVNKFITKIEEQGYYYKIEEKEDFIF